MSGRAASARPLRLLTVSGLFPNPVQPRHGIFVAERLRQMLATGAVTASIVAPVPWFPSAHPRFGRYADLARVPREGRFEGCPVVRPRYPAIPKLGMGPAPLLMAAGLRPVLAQLAPAADLVDAHFLYPDGVAAVILARRLGLPVVLTARGSDVNQFGEFAVPRRWLRWAVRHADHVFAVSAALGARLEALGAPPERLSVAPNGVDLTRFGPRDRAVARARLRLPATGTLLLAVGNLLELKGHHLLIDAVAALPEVSLVILGDGPRRAALEAQVGRLGLGGRVDLPGTVPQDQLPDWYAAADFSVLASSREGMPNVVLESLACGTPVVATRVGGVPEIVDAPAAGRLVDERSAAGLREALAAALASPPDRSATRRHAERFAWRPVVERQIEIMRAAVAGRAAPLGREVADAR